MSEILYEIWLRLRLKWMRAVNLFMRLQLAYLQWKKANLEANMKYGIK